MRGGTFEQNLGDMEVQPTVNVARANRGTIVGIKTAHYAGPEWAPSSAPSKRAPPPTSR